MGVTVRAAAPAAAQEAVAAMVRAAGAREEVVTVGAMTTAGDGGGGRHACALHKHEQYTSSPLCSRAALIVSPSEDVALDALSHVELPGRQMHEPQPGNA